MRKKTPRKIARTRYSSSVHATFLIRYILVGLGCIALAFAGKFLLSATTTVHVLGASTGPVYLADNGGDSGGGTSGGDSGGSVSGGSGSGGSVSGSSGESGGSGSGDTGSGVVVSGSTNGSVSGSTLVDCVGPDGKHFTTEFHNCQEVNQQWGHTNFVFTKLEGSTEIQAPESEGTDSSKLEVQKESNKKELHLQTPNGQIEIKQEDNGKVSIHSKNENGSEVELKGNSLEDVNHLLEEQGISISSQSANGLAFSSHGVNAHTNFPLTFDPTTNTLSITTPNGTHTIAVLPDQAVNAVLNSGIMSHVQSENLGDQTATATANLTELNSQAVFEINGVSEKKLLGVFPVGFAKTSFVSAENGQVVQTNESALNKLLELFSF